MFPRTTRAKRTRSIDRDLVGAAITLREAGVVVRVNHYWVARIHFEAQRALLRILGATVKRLGRSTGGWLPKDTGKLRERTRRFVSSLKARRFRVYSTAPYSKYVTTAPSAWARAIADIKRQIAAHHKVVPLECTVQRPGRAPMRRVLRFPFRLSMLRPVVFAHVVHRLPNEIRGRYQPVVGLRQQVAAAARRLIAPGRGGRDVLAFGVPDGPAPRQRPEP